MRLRKLFITLCMAIFTAVLCVFGLIACKQETFALKIVFKEAPYAYTRGETVDAYDFIEKQEGVSYAFAFDYLTISETGETVVSKKESVSGNTYYLKEASRYTLYVTATKGEEEISDSTQFDVLGEKPVLLPPSSSLAYEIGSSAQIGVLLARIAPTVIPASTEIVVDYYTYQESKAPTLESVENNNPKTKTELDPDDPTTRITFDKLGIYEFHMIGYNGERSTDATFKVQVIPDQTLPVEGISAYKNAEFAKKPDGSVDSSTIRLIGSPNLSNASYAVLEDEFVDGQVARFEFYGRNMPSYIGLFNQDNDVAADPNSMIDGGKGYIFTMERLGVTDTARVYGFIRLNSKTSALKASNDSYPFENFGFSELEDDKHYFFEIALKSTGKTETGIKTWGGIPELEGKTLQHMALFYSLYQVNDDPNNPYTLVAHSQTRFESSVGGSWFEAGEEIKGKLVAYSSITKDVTFKYYKDTLINNTSFDEKEIEFDEASGILSWNDVDGAVNYIVTTSDVSTDRFAILPNNKTSLNVLKEYQALSYFEPLKITVYASVGNNTFSDKKYTYELVKYPIGMENVIVSGELIDYDVDEKTLDVSLLGGFYDNARSNSETHGTTAEYVTFNNTYTLDENGTYVDVYFQGNNMPIVEFFADDANEYFMSTENVKGKGFLIDNGLAASTANVVGSKSKYNGWSEYDGYFSYGITSYYNRRRDAQSYTVGSYMENDTSTIKRKTEITMYSYGEGTQTQKTYVDFSMYSLAQVQSAKQNYRYTVGMYKDAENYVWLDAKLYKVDGNGTETLFAKWLTKAIMEGSAHSVTRDKLNDGETISGKIVLRGAIKGRTADNRATERNIFTTSMPYVGSGEHDQAMQAPMANKDATFNVDGTVTLKSNYIASQSYDTLKNAMLGYVALEGKYGLGTYVDFYFTGNNMPQVSFFNQYVTDNVTATNGSANDNTGLVVFNGLCYAGGGSFSNEAYRFWVYGPNRVNAQLNDMSRAYINGNNASNASPLSMETLKTMPDQRFKYTVGFYADASNNVYISVDVDKVDENGAKTADYFDVEQALVVNNVNITTGDIKGDRIVVYGALNGGEAITFSYSEPYAKN